MSKYSIEKMINDVNNVKEKLREKKKFKTKIDVID